MIENCESELGDAYKLALHEALEEAVDLPRPAQDVIEADLRLQFQFANQRVVYIDSWIDSSAGTHLQREILFNSTSQVAVNNFVAGLPEEQQAIVKVELQPDPSV